MSAISGISGSSNAWAAANSQRSQHQAKMFAKVDSDSSGGVNASELGTMLSDISQKTGVSMGDSSELFAKMDSNSDGSLSSDELGEGMKSLRPPPPSTMEFAQTRSSSGKGDDLFASVDANGDGSLNADEIQALKDKIQSDTGENVDEKIASLDSDGDGSLSKAEVEAGRPSGPQGTPPPGGPPPAGGPGGPKAASGTDATSDSSTTYDALDTNEDGTVSSMERLAGTLKDLAASSTSDGSSGGFNAQMAKFAQTLYQQISGHSLSGSAAFASAFSATA